MGASVGDIDLDLHVNQNGFNRAMSGIQNLAMKAGKALAAAFAVKSLVQFGAQCIELGSDLAEVQNVVDVTFPGMTAQVDKFAQSAAASFGLSETMAKQFTGTFGAMAKSFGFSEKSAYNMSTALTGLAGDVASFYNISQDEAFTKLKSVFTGETETLKDLGVVMTQSALDAYALANGYGKTTKSMSEAEKVALRYAFVQEKLKSASKYFSNTSDQWANQVRLLKLQFDSLKASIGQGLIAVLKPVIKALNTLLGKINQVASAFSKLVQKLTGKKKESTTSSATAEADALTDSLTGAGSAADKTKKKIKDALYGFDELNVVPTADDSSGSGSGGSGVPDISGDETGDVAEDVEEINPVLDKAIEKLKEMAGLLKSGFEHGLGKDFETSLKRQQDHIYGIGESLKGIFTDPEVVGAADGYAQKVAFALGQMAGSAVSIGMSFSENLLGGIDGYLKNNSNFIKERIVGTLDASGAIWELSGKFSEAFSDVMEVFRSEAAKKLTESLISIFANPALTLLELGEKLGRDLLNVFVQPFVDNKDALKVALQSMISSASEVVSTIADTVQEICDKVLQVYDERIKPVIDNFTQDMSDLIGGLVEGYNTYIAPVVEELGEKVSELWRDHVGPALKKAMDFIGSLAEVVYALWKTQVKPFFDFLISTILPIIAPIIKTIGKIALNIGEAIMDAIGAIFDIASGLLDFITGIFMGDWEKAWGGIKKVVQGVADFIGGIVNGIIGHFEALVNGAIDGINTIIRAANKLPFFDLDELGSVSFGRVDTNLDGESGGEKSGNESGKWSGANIPKLATGGYIKPNTPQLAMIGDNRHQGEVVAPDDKIYEITSRAVSDALKMMFQAQQGQSQQAPVEVNLYASAELAPFFRQIKIATDKENERIGKDFRVVTV